MCLNCQNPRPAPGLPTGWKYVFREPSKADPRLKAFRGLRIIAPNNVIFSTIQRARNSRTAPVADLGHFDEPSFYEFVGLSGAVDPKYPNPTSSSVPGRQNDPVLSDGLKIGSRCYAKFTNGSYYWGEIASINEGASRSYDVQFDDGDFLPNIEPANIVSEKVAADQGVPLPPPIGVKASLALLDLHAQRCKECAMCTKEDCGCCRVCKNNACESSPRKEACLMKVCCSRFFCSCVCYMCFSHPSIYFHSRCASTSNPKTKNSTYPASRRSGGTISPVGTTALLGKSRPRI